MTTTSFSRIRDRRRRAFLITVAAYIGFNVIATAVGVIARLPDVTSTHATTDHVALGQVFFPDGTIISPPLATMLVAGALVWAVATKRAVLTCGAILCLGMALTSIAEVTGLGNRPTLFSPARWHTAVVVGSVYGVIGLLAVLTGLAYLWSTFQSRRRARAA